MAGKVHLTVKVICESDEDKGNGEYNLAGHCKAS